MECSKLRIALLSQQCRPLAFHFLKCQTHYTRLSASPSTKSSIIVRISSRNFYFGWESHGSCGRKTTVRGECRRVMCPLLRRVPKILVNYLDEVHVLNSRQYLGGWVSWGGGGGGGLISLGGASPVFPSTLR